MRLTILLLAIATAAPSQLIEEFNPARTNCCLPGAAQNLADQLKDWNQLGRYHADNQRLLGRPAPAGRVVFMGDSITDGWKLDRSFPGKPYVNRGISGQTTPQMLVRMYPDVIDLKPAAMVVLAGTNDIAGNTGPETLKMIADNIRAMTELAQGHGIKVVLCGLLPVSDYTARPQTARRPPADVLKLNAWLKQYAAERKAVYCDYHGALADSKGMLTDGMSRDGLHPNEQGYEKMVPVVAAAIRQALGK
ncbi:MAG: SGNH/GDSL hydrolase family protein [Bryobacteraceae bacterium]